MRGDFTKTHTIPINDDDECEISPEVEYFSSFIALESGVSSIDVTVPQTIVRIDDNNEPECGKSIRFHNVFVVTLIFFMSRANTCWL